MSMLIPLDYGIEKSTMMKIVSKAEQVLDKVFSTRSSNYILTCACFFSIRVLSNGIFSLLLSTVA